MAIVWSGPSPVSLPPRWLAYLAGFLILVMAVVGSRTRLSRGLEGAERTWFGVGHRPLHGV